MSKNGFTRIHFMIKCTLKKNHYQNIYQIPQKYEKKKVFNIVLEAVRFCSNATRKKINAF